jgi:hypothetical protein
MRMNNLVEQSCIQVSHRMRRKLRGAPSHVVGFDPCLSQYAFHTSRWHMGSCKL